VSLQDALVIDAESIAGAGFRRAMPTAWRRRRRGPCSAMSVRSWRSWPVCGISIG